MRQGTTLWLGVTVILIALAMALSLPGQAAALTALGETVTPTNTTPPETPTTAPTETPTAVPTETPTTVPPTDTPVPAPTDTPAPGPTQPPAPTATVEATVEATTDPTATPVMALPVTGTSETLGGVPIAMVAGGLLLLAAGMTVVWRLFAGGGASAR